MPFGIDLMGFEAPLEDFINALENLLSERKSKAFFYFYLSKNWRGKVPEKPFYKAVFCEDVVDPKDSLLTLFRKRQDSTLARGLKDLKEGQIASFLTSASTPHLTAFSKEIVGLQKGLTRPALLSKIPKENGFFYLLDSGAGYTQSQKRFEELLKMALPLFPSKKPLVALLNIGSEEKKGSPKLRKIFDKIKADSGRTYTFFGNCEPTFVFDSKIDILLTDGFSGNLVLKTIEGVCRFLLKSLNAHSPEHQQSLADWSLSLRKGKSLALLAGATQKIYKTHNYSSAAEFALAAVEMTEN